MHANSQQGTEDINWENYLNNHSKRPEERINRIRGKDDLPAYDANMTKTENLFDHLMWQVHMSKFNEKETEIATSIIGNIDESGYLASPIEDIALKRNFDLALVEKVLLKIQEFDPLGVGARDLRDCLLIQAKYLPEGELVREVIAHHLEDIEKKKYEKVAKALHVGVPRIVACVETIRTLDPRPGRQFFNESAQYIVPDIYINMVNGEPVIVQNDDGLPRLRLSSYYQSLLSNTKASEKEKEYIHDKMRSALWLIRSIHQRQRTIYKVTQSIVRIQREFLEKGVTALKPMVLKDVANDIGMHESTVSRVTTNKYIHTPQGIFELKYFFNSGIKSTHGGDMASEAVKSRIKKIIGSEDPRKPFSDQELVEILRQSDVDIARRTVSKYREMLGILSSSKRKNLYH
ncbi:MAG: RNA polymerase factor sigma-54 [Bdellovibrionota bacterium]